MTSASRSSGVGNSAAAAVRACSSFKTWTFVRAGGVTCAAVSVTTARPTRSRLAAAACTTAAATPANRATALRPGGPSRAASEASTNTTQRTGTSLSMTRVMSVPRRADAFQAIILGGSPGA